MKEEEEEEEGRETNGVLKLIMINCVPCTKSS